MFVRWSNLTTDGPQQHRLPGYRDPSAVRRFDVPEALDMRFYEVHAKSVLNRVPEKSRMPFRWSINPYRGCSQACSYCLHGRTPILMADGKHRELGDLDVGDTIYGTEQGPRYRRYAHTTVLAKWITIKPAFRVTLEDGTELIASGDHRFLTDRGWKHVTSTEQGPECRPHLTLVRDRPLRRAARSNTGVPSRIPVWTDSGRRVHLAERIRKHGRYDRREAELQARAH